MHYHTSWFLIHLFHLQKSKTFHSLRRTINSYKFRKIFLIPLNLIFFNNKYLTSPIQVVVMNSQKCNICKNVSIVESPKAARNVAHSGASSSVSELQEKEEKSRRCLCKESIFNSKRKPISFTIKRKNLCEIVHNPLQLSNNTVSKQNQNVGNTHSQYSQANFSYPSNVLPLSQGNLNVVPIPFNILNHSFFNAKIQHRVYRSSATDYSNVTKSTQLDKQKAWSLRRLQHTRLGQSLSKKPPNPKSCLFKIMSYNVLAQELLEEHIFLYAQHNPNALKWDQRWYAILEEIRFHNADILCLQEVQVSQLDQFSNDLGRLGYKGIYKQRTGIRHDGCAIYYKKSIFNLVDYVTIEFNQKDIPVLDRDNVAIVAKFAPKNNEKNEFVVATTHLLYNPKREDVRLAQTQVLLTEIDRIAYKFDSRRQTDHLPVIITGDFNLTPESPIYQFLTRGVLKYEHLTNRTLSKEQSQYANVTGKTLIPSLLRITDNCQHADLVEKRNKGDVSREEQLKLIHLQHSERNYDNKSRSTKSKSLFSTGTLSHEFNLRSAYVHKHGQDFEATTFQNSWVTVDYIFYSSDNVETKKETHDRLKLLSRYTLPMTTHLQGMRIPNMALGSDHLSLVVVFRLDP